MRGAPPSRPTPLARLVAALLLAVPPAVAQDAPPGGEAAPLVAALGAPTAAERAAALDALLSADPALSVAALSLDPPGDTAGRRAYARFAARAGLPAAVGPLLALAADPDAAVRAEAARGLVRVDLFDHRLGERVERVAALALHDPDVTVRGAAVEALGELEHPDAALVLADLVGGAGPTAPGAARALATSRAGAAQVAELLARAAGVSPARPGVDDPALVAELLAGYGRALGRGAEGPARGARVLAGLGASADPRVRRGAAQALDEALAEWDRLRRPERAAAFLAALGRAGWSPDALDHAVARRALSDDGTPLAALAAGERLERRHLLTPGADGARAVAAGAVYQAAALLALGDDGEARARLGRAEAVLVGELERRPDHGPLPFSRERGRAEESVDLLQRLAAVRALEVFALVGTLDPLAPEVLSAARRAHLAALEAHLVAVRADSDAYASDWEAVLGRALAPRVLLAPSARGDGAIEWIERHGRAYAALAAVSPTELPGFLGAVEDGGGRRLRERLADLEPALVDPLADPQRLALLQGLRIADLERVGARAQDPQELANRALWRRVEQRLLEAIATDAERGYVPLLDYRSPATSALAHAADLRAVGASERALEHALSMRRELEDAPNAPTGTQGTWVGARVALAVGTAMTDTGDGGGARTELLAAHDRLEALENEMRTRLVELEAGREGPLQLAAVDPLERRRLELQLERTRDLRAQVLLGLAVNANVRLRDTDAAKGFFDRAWELRQDDFMRVLYACYAARAGRSGEARFALAAVTPAPELEYNLACTHALLGDVERALVHLERALEGLDSRGARARQVEWARDDPDFDGLKGDPAFEALLARYAG